MIPVWALTSVSVAFKKARKAEHAPFASRARQAHEVPMLLYVCSCVTLPLQDDLPQYLLRPGAVWDGQALCHLSRHISQRCSPLLRASNCGQARAMCTSNRSQACLLSRARSKRTPHPGGTKCLFLSHTLMTRPAACGRSRRTSSSSGSSARRAGLEEARLVNLSRQSSVFPVLWQAIPVMIRLQRGCWATSRRRSSRRALQVCLS